VSVLDQEQDTMTYIRRMLSIVLAIGGAVIGSVGCDGRVDNELDETANTDPPYENLNPREELQRREQREQQAVQQPNPQTNVRTVADITGNAGQFLGEKVVLQGDVEEVYKGRGFRLDDESPLRGGIDDDLVVLGAKDASWKVDDGWGSTEVRVEGTIRRAKDADLEKELGWNLDSDVREAVDGEELVLVADNVQRIESAAAK
jgi:hypothetical protein